MTNVKQIFLAAAIFAHLYMFSCICLVAQKDVNECDNAFFNNCHGDTDGNGNINYGNDHYNDASDDHPFYSKCGSAAGKNLWKDDGNTGNYCGNYGNNCGNHYGNNDGKDVHLLGLKLGESSGQAADHLCPSSHFSFFSFSYLAISSFFSCIPG